MFDIKKVQEDAQREVTEERLAEAKRKIKIKLKAIDDANKIVRNLQRELEDLYVEIAQ